MRSMSLICIGVMSPSLDCLLGRVVTSFLHRLHTAKHSILISTEWTVATVGEFDNINHKWEGPLGSLYRLLFTIFDKLPADQ